MAVLWQRRYKVNLNSNHCMFSELPSASTRVCHTRAAAAAHPLEFEVSRCRMSQFAMYFLPAQVRMWNDLLYTLFDTGTPDWLKDASQLLVASQSCVFSSRGAGACGVAKSIYQQLCFSNLDLCSWGNNNNNNNELLCQSYGVLAVPENVIVLDIVIEVD